MIEFVGRDEILKTALSGEGTETGNSDVGGLGNVDQLHVQIDGFVEEEQVVTERPVSSRKDLKHK